MRLSGHALPRGKRGAARGKTNKNVGRVQPAEPSRRCLSVFPITFIRNTQTINFSLCKTRERNHSPLHASEWPKTT